MSKKRRWHVHPAELRMSDVVSVEQLTTDGKKIEREVCTVLIDGDTKDERSEDVGIVRLIVAAPELLEALQGCVAFRNWELTTGGVTPEELVGTYERAEAAIRKATEG